MNEQWEREQAEEDADRLRKEEPPPAISRSEFLEWRAPRSAENNPTSLDNPLWKWLVRTCWDAYSANQLMSGPSSFESGPMWSFKRFGMSRTDLDDGRVIFIAGEHEDNYDPDFYIYNDVTVVHPTGEIEIFGYPRGAFPPTDFHSATLVGNSIYIIGNLGYAEWRKVGVTQIYKLSVESFKFEVIEAVGLSPGWISRHAASLADDGKTIFIEGGELWLGDEFSMRENIDSWAFDTCRLEWRQITKKQWQHWIMRRSDRMNNRLWEIRQELWFQKHAHHGFKSYWKYSDPPDFTALSMLYRTSGQLNPPEEGAGVGEYNVVIDGVNVRFKEHRFCVEVVVEGQLSDERLIELQQSTLSLLEKLDSAPYEIE